MADTTLQGLTTSTLADRAYRAIRDAITTGELRPGQKVTERGLAERLSVSPTPVREAIRRLEQDGLLERTGPRTVQVATFGDVAVQDLAEVEVALRGMVARFAARRATPEQLDRLDAILDEADDLLILIKQRHQAGQQPSRHLGRLLDAMQRFNEVVESCAGNPVLVRLLDQTRVFSWPERRARLLERISHDAEFGLHRYTSHRALVRALRAGDSAAAEALVIDDARGGLGDLLAAPAAKASVASP
ncbi:Transcriptional regulator, GntR family [[Actinomadura] parvosata subsp. kistnae]|uniref:GntR family transcriptional regulator n=1 Tax=[Actinomadura] parvosata subsp. kistnae TaxID=1909395 RepID=A0A1U9ZVK2_9ACTN|nr:GntR family transcriptional regulator [Nonomuraea sp. ATCC 55076]AQZ61983.1 GntR family transcriptional regulator [Nonomuraea sp. ATCC 55076]SPL99857.1 Transcriptional regulator, GntR family [Actinomadura parvosata subsp. kistnae]